MATLRPSPPIPIASQPTRADTNSGLVYVCAWCGRTSDEEGEWHESLAPPKSVTGSEVSHGLCPACCVREFPGIE